MSRLPLIGVTACSRQIGLHAYHISGDEYVQAVATAAQGLPVILASMAHLLAPSDILDGLDGILFTGSPSNIEPFHYQGQASAPGTAHDSARDAATLPLLNAAVEGGVPVLGICRGFQEMNVALGGSLHQNVHQVSPFMDHRHAEQPGQPLDAWYAPAHDLHVQPGGLLASLGLPDTLQVNSIHAQGVERLAPGLRVEARAPDGLIEAVSVEASKAFALGVQWHPEWQVSCNPHYLAIFQAFGDACRERAKKRDIEVTHA
ncbi:MAG: gamma-glutamyl-gamma-aminobutyrate hydrolase family protein [Pseudomonas sp.]|uniref:gamma-glutamyl-gamma-aminobutyrate hydrolase family protein n=1 Tax=unclassified Pseudomonas TaxID=196821 RepID=UPI000730381B|nr:gamma-glutamyl-gamma-aminobutyrate hydrolase family protein [Pseudomonas sp. L5B5]KTC44189.1 gamma-glutamyl-gamma-aminobutyrate hydrolase [Pseudomonas sp. ABAC61]UCZ82768.1 gamma-glutamyl-gamma-aminobutyrate hydrolase family protein [Pseudomonas sp. L5B5]